jgi:hypothetical protein
MYRGQFEIKTVINMICRLKNEQSVKMSTSTKYFNWGNNKKTRMWEFSNKISELFGQNLGTFRTKSRKFLDKISQVFVQNHGFFRTKCRKFSDKMSNVFGQNLGRKNWLEFSFWLSHLKKDFSVRSRFFKSRRIPGWLHSVTVYRFKNVGLKFKV